jgi:hypothetical protein
MRHSNQLLKLPWRTQQLLLLWVSNIITMNIMLLIYKHDAAAYETVSIYLNH